MHIYSQFILKWDYLKARKLEVIEENYLEIWIQQPKLTKNTCPILASDLKFIFVNQCNQTGNITTLDGTPLKLVDKFTYLGSSVSLTENTIDMRLTKAWTAIDMLLIIWKSDLTDKMKHCFFQAAVVSILLYGCTTWTLTKQLKKKLDSNYTRMLRAILNKFWQLHPTKNQLYGHLPPIRKTIQVRRPKHAGHCWAHKWCTPMDPHIWPGKSRMTSSNIHSAAIWGYGM